MAHGIAGGRITELDDEPDVVLDDPGRLYGPHTSAIPMGSAVMAPRLFYGARFFNQAVAVERPEAPLVRGLHTGDPAGRSWDEVLGEAVGAVRAKEDAEVLDVGPGRIRLRTASGDADVPLYENFAFNRKSQLTNMPVVKKGDRVPAGALLARSNYTDDSGTMAMGLNARVGVVPYKGFSMDDAVVISDAFAKRLTSEHVETDALDYRGGTRGGLGHFVAIFPNKFKREQLGHLDEDGVARPGSILQRGDPYVLATRPKAFSSQRSQLGKLSKVMRQSRADASLV